MAKDQNKYIKQTFNCIPIVEVLYTDQSKYYLYIIYHPRDEVWSGKENLSFYNRLPKNNSEVYNWNSNKATKVLY